MQGRNTASSPVAEASDLLAGQLDENLVVALAGQLIVPRLADWCAVWLEDEATGRWETPDPGGWTGDGTAGTGPRLARVWHGSENRIEELRRALEKDPRAPHPVLSSRVPSPTRGPAGHWTAGVRVAPASLAPAPVARTPRARARTARRPRARASMAPAPTPMARAPLARDDLALLVLQAE